MIRRISTKLVLAVLATVVLPFVAFAFYIDVQMGERLTRHVVRQALLGLAKDLAGQADDFVFERYQDVEQWADSPLVNDALDEALDERERLALAAADGGGATAVWDAAALARWSREEAPAASPVFELHHRSRLTREFDRFLALKGAYDLLLLVDSRGRLVTSSSWYPEPDDGPLPRAYLESLFARDFSSEPWFDGALAGEIQAIDRHVSPYRLPMPAVEAAHDSDPAARHHLAFAAPVHDELPPHEERGVLFALVNWRDVQELVATPVVKDAFRGLVDEEEEPSPYAWIWASDADTILAHPDRSLYGKSVARDVELPELVAAVRADEDGWGLYPEYNFQGEDKNAAFRLTAGPARGGFGWVVGVGIDNDDIYATSAELRALLLGGTALVLAMAILWTFLIAHRATGPIRALKSSTRRVAEGALDERVEIRSKDELGALAEDFNAMTVKLKEQQERIVKAEKDAAWREMARQIAHDIKNPLTPMQLSLDLYERARRERPDGAEQILDRTLGLIRRQVANLQRIAGDFYEFTGGRRPQPEPVDVAELLDEVLHLVDAWAVELGVEIRRDGEGARVLADPGKLRRVFVNLVSNALQAMPDGGTLFVESSVEDERVRVCFRDTGEGVPEEARAHLFEPYFTTKSEGTGLGLAISKQVVEQIGGTIQLDPAADGRGTVATVRLPLYEALSEHGTASAEKGRR